MQKNYLIVIAAPSGAGKTTLCKRVLQAFPSLQLSISSTTRAPRGQEQNGVEYFFITPKEFESKIKQGRFAEWARVHDHYYGTSKDVVESAFAGNHSLLLDIDVQGAEQLRNSYPQECYRIFIAPPSFAELEVRLRKRGTESEEAIQKRLRNSELEMQEGQKFDRVIINDHLDRAYAELEELLKNKLNLAPALTSRCGGESV